VKLHLTTGEGQHRFSGHGYGYVAVNGVRYERSVLVTPTSVTAWAVDGLETLSTSDFEPVLALQPDVLILGTGSTTRFAARELTLALASAGVGLEVMDNGAACRTYNIVAAEGRRVAAAILLIGK
jgi:uncharacterized protein